MDVELITVSQARPTRAEIEGVGTSLRKPISEIGQEDIKKAEQVVE
ncbi:hypothetical protein [Archaeoglobus sp.]